MSDAEQEHQAGVSLPQVNYFEKATDLVASYDRLLVSVYSSLIAGVTLLLVYKEIAVWVGAFFLLALVMFIFGVGHTFLHMTFHAKMLLALEALTNGTEHVPNAIEGEEPTLRAYLRMKAYAQRAYAGQLYYLFLGVLSGGVAVIVHLWQYSWRAGIVVVVSVSFLISLALAFGIWRKVICSHSQNRAK